MNPEFRGGAWRALALVGLVIACGGDPPTQGSPGVARLVLAPTTLTLRLGESRGISALAYDARGQVLTVPVTWSSSDPTVASVAPTSLVTAVAPGTATITATAGARSEQVAVTVERVRVARVLMGSALAELLAGTDQMYSATPIGVDGADATGWPVRWSVGDTTIAQIDSRGVLRALRAGRTDVRATIDTAVTSTLLAVRGALDLAVHDLAMAQAIQDDTLGVPMIRDGLPMLLSAVVTADAPVPSRAWITATCADPVSGAERWRDSTQIDTPLDSVARLTGPLVQWLVPSDRFGSGLVCHVLADPASLVPDANRANNRFPRTGGRRVTSIEVPPFEITFVPVVLAADGGVTGNVTTANVEQYLGTARQLLPLGRIEARVGAAYTTTTQFGSGQDVAWRAILRELEARRVLEGRRGHYYGVLRPGAGVTFVQFSGFGFVTGWTAVSVQVGWFNRESAARETVAHELGHNFGRPHAPCGGPASPDPAYPYTDAAIGVTGWDSWTATQGGRGAYIPPETRDLMSYCRPVWISDYNFRRMIEGRRLMAAAGAGSGAGSVALVRGEIVNGAPALDPVHLVTGPAEREEPAGEVLLELLDDAGRIVARHRTAARRLDHDGARLFVTRVALPPGVTPGAVRAQVAGAATLRPLGGGSAVPVSRRETPEGTTLQWDAAAVPELLVRDERTGEVLSFARGGSVQLPRRTGRLAIGGADGRRITLR